MLINFKNELECKVSSKICYIEYNQITDLVSKLRIDLEELHK